MLSAAEKQNVLDMRDQISKRLTKWSEDDLTTDIGIGWELGLEAAACPLSGGISRGYNGTETITLTRNGGATDTTRGIGTVAEAQALIAGPQ